MKANQKKRQTPKIRREDIVMVISGKEKGRTGRILSIDWKQERVLVEGLNMVTKHTKPNATNQKGGMLKQESPIHYSNVQLYNPSLKRGVRIKITKTDSGVRNRVCVKSGEVLG